MMCAIHAARRGRKVLLLDHSSKIGRKILISGGGRCNFTNINAGPANYVSKNPHFAKSALARYTPGDFIDLVKRHRIPFYEKKLGQLFCHRSAQDIVDMLVDECDDAGAEFKLSCTVKSVSKNGRFIIDTSHGEIESDSLVIASGGLSIPKIGATGFGYDLAKQFGLKIVPTAPALVGFNWNRAELKQFGELSGVSVDSVAACSNAAFRENILFTHTGLSGPAILQVSLYWNKGIPLLLNVIPDKNIADWLLKLKKQGVRSELKNVLAEQLPKRFAERFCELYFESKPVVQLSEKAIADLEQLLENWQITPSESVGYMKAEVTRGGVDTDELSSKTMESKKVPGLFFIGEVVDVTGQLGGYNFQWAWASAVACAQQV